ncbi:MAG: trypsin-like peptidase domain-containing protein [Anaerolineales bacterium]|nr:trypsin-like peptidase domain-containing protein [Anaerolineales bacterium]
MNNQFLHTRRILLWLGLLLPALALACQAVIPEQAAPPQPAITVVAPTPVVLASAPQVVSEEAVLVDLYEQVNPSVVNITIYGSLSGQVEALGQGSGFVYDIQGNIVTNAHVVHGASEIEVTFYDGLVRTAQPVGEDLHSDLAVVRVDLPPGINPLPLGRLSEVAVGQTVVAIGNPFGLSGTLTRGIVSALGRTIPALTIFSIPQAIQTDAAINPGNSGGPLLNMRGEVIGVNAQIETGGEGRSNLGVGFAIPVSIVERVIPSLIENGKYAWPWLGVIGNDVTPALVQAMNLPLERGAYLIQIVEDGPAEKAGLQGATENVTINGRSISIGGDVITAIDGQPVNTFDDLLIYIALQTIPGQEVTLTILRDGNYQDITLNLQPRPE